MIITSVLHKNMRGENGEDFMTAVLDARRTRKGIYKKGELCEGKVDCSIIIRYKIGNICM